LSKVIVPMMVPYVFAALRISFGVAWKVTLTAELFGGNAGIGYLLNVARQEFDTETIFAEILFILLFVACMEVFVFRPLQRRLDRRYRV
jgi:ABC-type nitrate/sulfonate/bicarbonate transport system permease component